MDMKPPSPVIWMKRVQELQQKGAIVCPLMGMTFQADDCVCDIPKTRALFFQLHKNEVLCSVADACIPTQIYFEQAGDERNPRAPVPRKLPSGIWTASFRKEQKK